MYEGIMIRGGVTIGDLYHRNNIVYGPAMIEAYRLESKCAIYPRIIMSEDMLVIGIMKTLPEQNTLEEEIDYVDCLIRKACDGYYYLDFLGKYEEFDCGYDYYNFLKITKKIIEEQAV